MRVSLFILFILILVLSGFWGYIFVRKESLEEKELKKVILNMFLVSIFGLTLVLTYSLFM